MPQQFPIVSTFLVAPFHTDVTSTSPLLTAMAPPTGYSSAQLIFEDQFSTFNSSIWNKDIGDVNHGRYTANGVFVTSSNQQFSGFPNGLFDAEYFSPTQVFTGPSGLSLGAQLDNTFPGYTWVSGCISTHGKFATPPPGFYGQFRALQPDCSNGMWCRILFLDPNGVNEVDLQNGGVFGVPSFNQTMAPSLLTGTTRPPQNINVNTNISQAFHIYGVEYISGNSVKIFFDGQLVQFYESRNTFIPSLVQYEIVILLGVFFTAAPGVPIVTNQGFTKPFPLTTGQQLGTMVATNNPQAWQFIVSPGSSNFAINNQGVVTVASSNPNSLTPQVFTLQVRAQNPVGQTNGLAVVNITAGAPIVQNATFTITTPLSNGQFVGRMTSINVATSWTIIAGNGNAPGNFNVDNNGNITVSAQGAALGVSTQTLTLAATNAQGTGTGAATVNIQPSVSAPTISNVRTIASVNPVFNVASGGSTFSNNLNVNGVSANPNSTITMFRGGSQVGTTTTDGAGNWTFPLGILADGSYSVAATVTSGGSTSAQSPAYTFTISPAITGATIGNNISNNVSFNWSGWSYAANNDPTLTGRCVPTDTHTLVLTVGPTDNYPDSPSNRSQIAANNPNRFNDDVTVNISYEAMLSASSPINNSFGAGAWCVFAQYHDSGASFGPPFEINLGGDANHTGQTGDMLNVDYFTGPGNTQTNIYKSGSNLTRGVFHTFDLQIRPSAAATGFFKVSIDGVQVVNFTGAWSTRLTPYFWCFDGFYRGPPASQTQTQVVTFRNFVQTTQ